MKTEDWMGLTRETTIDDTPLRMAEIVQMFQILAHSSSFDRLVKEASVNW